jgi:hypothetical protein
MEPLMEPVLRILAKERLIHLDLLVLGLWGQKADILRVVTIVHY